MKLGNVLALAVAVSGLSLVGCEEKPAPAPKTTTPPATTPPANTPTTPPANTPPAPGTPAPTPG
jgi:hypothetical protein